LEEELSRHRFVLEPVFVRHLDASPLADRVLKFNPDYVLWNAPASIDRMTMQSISDAGVPILAILGTRVPLLPGRIYRQSYDRALKRGLEEWKASGQIDRIVVARGTVGNVAQEFGSVLEESSLPYQMISNESDTLSHYMESLAPDPRTGIFFADDMFFAMLCAMVPEDMFQLFRRHRVIVRRKVTMHTAALPTDITLDWLCFPDQRMARRIATDMGESKGALSSQDEVFEAEWRPRTPLAEIIQPSFEQ
jgi:hypothetical protein